MHTIVVTISCRCLSSEDVRKQYVQWCCNMRPISFPDHAGFSLLSCCRAWRMIWGKASPQLYGHYWVGGNGRVNRKKDGKLYLKKFWWVSDNKGRNRLTSNTVSSQSLASIFNCLRLSESPTSRMTLGRPDGLGTGATPASACFFLDQSWNARGRKVKPRLKLCVLSNILVDPMPTHPGGSAACGCGVNCTRAKEWTLAQETLATSWGWLGMYLTMKLWSSLYDTLKQCQKLDLSRMLTNLIAALSSELWVSEIGPR